jgi:hypothetical protein
MTVDQAVAADRKYFDEHPDEEEYIREFVPGEFGVAELPEIPPGFRYATHVSVMLRADGAPVGRYRRLMTVCEGIPDIVDGDDEWPPLVVVPRK